MDGASEMVLLDLNHCHVAHWVCRSSSMLTFFSERLSSCTSEKEKKTKNKTKHQHLLVMTPWNSERHVGLGLSVLLAQLGSQANGEPISMSPRRGPLDGERDG